MKKANKSKPSPVKGIHFCHSTNKWYVRVEFNGYKYFAGRHREHEDAVKARNAFKKALTRYTTTNTLTNQVNLEEDVRIHFCNTTQKYLARFKSNGTYFFIGRFDSKRTANTVAKQWCDAICKYYLISER